MICPKCKADTRVVNSRPHRDDPTVIQRRRWCDDCGHKFNTQEATVDIVARRRLIRKANAKHRAKDPEAARTADTAERRARRALADEAAKSGRPAAQIREAWGLPAKASRNSQLNP